MTAAELLSLASAEGVALALVGNRLTWTANRPPPAALLAGLAAHKGEIIAALSAANDATHEPTRNAWTVTRNGSPICRMVGQPMTHPEALAAARWRWPDADILET